MNPFTGPRGGDDNFGNAMNSQAHRINMAMSTIGQTLKQISDQSGIENLNRIHGHMRWLLKRDFAERRDSGWALTTDAAKHLTGSAGKSRAKTN